MVLNPPEPTKEKEKQGFFRAIKKKKKKTQIVSTGHVVCLTFYLLVIH